MHTFVMQDWITVRGNNNNIIQSESEWLDLTQYEDVVLWVDVREVTGTTVTLLIQTSPTKDEAFFGVGNVSSMATLSAGTKPPVNVLMSSATPPIARYLRWQIQGPNATFDATFRIFVAANSPGS